MNYREFVGAIEKKMRLYTDPGLTIMVHRNVKNNGIERRGVTFLKEGMNIAPTIYLEEYFEQYEEGKDLNSICREILELYEEIRVKKSLHVEMLLSYDAVKSNLFCKLVNYDENRERMEAFPGVPYRIFKDLAVTVYLMIEIRGIGTATMQVTGENLRQWQVTEELLFRDAWRNTKCLLPAKIQTLSSVIAEIVEGSSGKESVKKENREAERDSIYVLTNQAGYLGAVCLLYDHLMEQVADFLKESYYIIPSSIHEVMIIPESSSPGAEVLDAMIQEINATQVAAEEILAGHCYYFDRRNGCLNQKNYKKSKK
ncbi:MAG TPA: hypothetical protein DCZ20_06145 [Lachnospiraceae bacterium]|nr:hypothetical protein [Lachnospiraceae bacterium]